MKERSLCWTCTHADWPKGGSGLKLCAPGRCQCPFPPLPACAIVRRFTILPLALAGIRECGLYRRKQQRDQDANKGDHDQQLDERKTV